MANVSAAKPNVSGAIYRADTSATLPTDATTALASDFVEQGYVSEDGVTNSCSPEMSDIKAWGGTIVYSSQTGKTDTWKFKLIDSLDSNLLTTVYGEDNVTVGTDGSISINANADEPEEFAWVIEMVLKGDKAKRVVIPCGKITAIGDIVYKDSEVIGYELTITAYPDDSENTHYEYISA